MRETNSVFTEQQKQIINKELREIVPLPAKYPEIVFKSTDVTGKSRGNGEYDVKVGGDLTLGVTRRIVIPVITYFVVNPTISSGRIAIDVQIVD